MEQIVSKEKLSPLKIAAIYAVAGGLWILFSDRLLASLIENIQLLTRFQTYKGWGFVAVTALLIYWLIKRYVSEIRNSAETLRKSEKYNRDLFELSPIGLALCRMDGSLVEVNNAFAKIIGRTVKETLTLSYWDFTPGKYADQEARQLESLKITGCFGPYEKEYIHEDGHLVPVRLQGLLIERGEKQYIWSSAEDITERKLAEERISLLTRLYSVLSKTNESIIRTDEPEELYRQVCRIIVEDGGFRMAWIGLVDPDTLLMNPVAVCGHEDGYLKEKRISFDEKIPEGRGPTGTTIRTGGCFICNDIENDPVMSPWRDEALKRGYCSSAAIALRSGTQLIGTLNIYASVAYFFHGEEINLLKALAEDISYAIESMEVEKQRVKAELKLQVLTRELEDRVKNRTAELKDSQRALMSLLEDLNLKSEELRSANDRLKELDRLKSIFIASMSHELRTPLNSVIGFSSVLRNEWAGPVNEEQKNLLTTINRSGKHLLALINDVIDISKIESGKLDTRLEDFDLQDVINEAMDSIMNEAAEKKLNLTAETPHLPMRSDRRRLLQCIMNLLSNAVKFTPAGSARISVRRIQDSESRSPEREYIEISVEDTGIGIKEEDIPRLFQSFVRLDSPLRASVPGTGLGLYLTRKLVTETMGGDILVESRHGAGSRFTIRIPENINNYSPTTIHCPEDV